MRVKTTEALLVQCIFRHVGSISRDFVDSNTVADQSACVQIALDRHFFIKELKLTNTDLLCIAANYAE
jgi:hypothetical protein